ncbi:MAG: hypothetical protein MSIBF_04155 [Candidatus Altiarchaeales archaeon IMC4]|nr:MAG: hypothetical protein MSIBF_04155 [Candidatus Altiarchaeales archaeon IMC4]
MKPIKAFLVILSASLLIIQATVCAENQTDMLGLKWGKALKNVGDINLFNLETDGVDEIYASSYTDTGAYLYVLSLNGTQLDRLKIQHSDVGRDEDVKIIHVDDIDYNRKLDFLVGTEIKQNAQNIHFTYRMERLPEPGLDMSFVREQWRYEKSSMVLSALTENIDSDPQKEMITTSIDGNIYIFGVQGLKKTINIGDAVWGVFVSDINRDGNKDFIAGSFSGITLFDNSGAKLWKYETQERIFSVFAEDIDGDNAKEVIGLSENNIYVLSNDGTLKWKYGRGDLTANVWVADMNDDERMEILVAAGNTFYLLNRNGEPLWSYNIKTKPLKIVVKDIDSDKEPEIIVGTSEDIRAYDINIDLKDRADHYLDRAKRLSIEGNCGSYVDFDSLMCSEAVGLANAARKLYEEVRDQQSVSECDKVIAQADKTMSGAKKREMAGGFYNNAVEAYNKEDYGEAVGFLERASSLYNEIKDGTGAAKCDKLLLDTRSAADAILNQTREQFNVGNYQQAVTLSNNLVPVYTAFDETIVIYELGNILNISTLHVSAQSQMSDTRRYIMEGDYEKAKTAAESAMRIYKSIGFESGINESRGLLEDAIDYIEATKYLSDALTYYSAGDYYRANESAASAAVIYLGLNESQMANESLQVQSKAGKYLRASNCISDAERYLDGSDYENALKSTDTALGLYKELNDEGAVKNAQSLKQRIQDVQNRSNTIRTAIIGVAFVLLLTVAIAVIKKYSVGGVVDAVTSAASLILRRKKKTAAPYNKGTGGVREQIETEEMILAQEFEKERERVEALDKKERIEKYKDEIAEITQSRSKRAERMDRLGKEKKEIEEKLKAVDAEGKKVAEEAVRLESEGSDQQVLRSKRLEEKVMKKEELNIDRRLSEIGQELAKLEEEAESADEEGKIRDIQAEMEKTRKIS